MAESTTARNPEPAAPKDVSLDALQRETEALLNLLKNRNGTRAWHGFLHQRLTNVKRIIDTAIP